MKSLRKRATFAVLALAGLGCLVVLAAGEAAPSILGQKERAAVFDSWLSARLDRVLPEIMRREKIDMWIVISRENNEDPVFLSLVPAAFLASWRTYMLVFFDRGKEGVERISVSRSGAGDLYREAWDPTKIDQWSCLARVVSERKPKRIGIDEGDVFPSGDGLTASLKRRLAGSLGPEYAARFCSAERLAVGWLERRIPEELEVYPHLASLAHEILREALSSKVITPGVTTTDDLTWWLCERTAELRLYLWAMPAVAIQRPKDSPFKDSVIHRGDLVMVDYVFSYLHLSTDTKANAYVLKEGEDEVPVGLNKVLAAGNRLQDILIGEIKEGLTGNQILASALKKAKEAGISGTILAHPVGFHGHGAGPFIGQWDRQEGVPGQGEYSFYMETCHSIELTARSEVPEWGNQVVTMEMEEDAAFTTRGAVFLDGRQTRIIPIK